ncbi:MAG: nitroreductase family protein [Bdellovibrionota bacterium]
MSEFSKRTLETREKLSRYDVDELILQRSSPRTMTGGAITDEELMTLFDAARWAPSSFNRQPWNFVYVHRSSSYWASFFDALTDANKVWCDKAAILVVLVSNQYNPSQPEEHYETASFDCGAAWENLSLQAVQDDLVAHGMEGFDKDVIARTIRLASHQKIEMMFALGCPLRKLGGDETTRKDRVTLRNDLESFVHRNFLRNMNQIEKDSAQSQVGDHGAMVRNHRPS